MTPNPEKTPSAVWVKPLDPDAARKKAPALLLMTGRQFGEVFPLTALESVIGRASTCSIRILEEDISRQHAIVRNAGGRFTVSDLAGTGGTYVNRVRVEGTADLADGDSLRTGRSFFGCFLQPATNADSALEATEAAKAAPPRIDEFLSTVAMSLLRQRGWSFHGLARRAGVRVEAIERIDMCAATRGRVAIPLLGATVDALLGDDLAASPSAFDQQAESELLAILSESDRERVEGAVNCLGAVGGVASAQALALLGSAPGMRRRTVRAARRARIRVMERLAKAGLAPGQLAVAFPEGPRSPGSLSLTSAGEIGGLSMPTEDQASEVVNEAPASEATPATSKLERFVSPFFVTAFLGWLAFQVGLVPFGLALLSLVVALSVLVGLFHFQIRWPRIGAVLWLMGFGWLFVSGLREEIALRGTWVAWMLAGATLSGSVMAALHFLQGAIRPRRAPQRVGDLPILVGNWWDAANLVVVVVSLLAVAAFGLALIGFVISLPAHLVGELIAIAFLVAFLVEGWKIRPSANRDGDSTGD